MPARACVARREIGRRGGEPAARGRDRISHPVFECQIKRFLQHVPVRPVPVWAGARVPARDGVPVVHLVGDERDQPPRKIGAGQVQPGLAVAVHPLRVDRRVRLIGHANARQDREDLRDLLRIEARVADLLRARPETRLRAAPEHLQDRGGQPVRAPAPRLRMRVVGMADVIRGERLQRAVHFDVVHQERDVQRRRDLVDTRALVEQRVEMRARAREAARPVRGHPARRREAREQLHPRRHHRIVRVRVRARRVLAVLQAEAIEAAVGALTRQQPCDPRARGLPRVELRVGCGEQRLRGEIRIDAGPVQAHGDRAVGPLVVA
ncbi:Uncharacterised protein [Burkholderia pseudomallei]|nr:hypothetical protein DP58_5796 [Burkholderia pseudomallei]AIO92785.1 hypothetical protein DP48_4472 [Burkholderia pseudomallei]KGC75363.1 hypothetical protein DP61_3973 [Burkholderia pseudomallei]CAJ2936091.1 Uncharacterised protein [Burkholderia pseudomallei]CAJ2975644.1 Uncharacterised protein [Burkholderia pseudomallei]